MTLALLLTAVTGAWAQSTEPTEWSLTPDADKKVWTLTNMPANNIELQVEYYAESNIFLGKEALKDKANISVLNGSTAVTFDDAGKSTTTVMEGNTVTAKFTGKKVIGMTVAKKAASLIVNPVVGQIIGSDGKNYDANAILPSGVTKVAMIAYVGNDAETSTTYNHGLALALEDVSATNMNWCSQTSVTCLGTQYVYDNESITWFNDLAGIANTDALVNHTGHTHDAASAARDYNSGTHPAGTSAWFLPSAGQWNKMATAAGNYANLKTNAGLKGGDSSAYWSSTECDAEHAWFFFPEFGGWNLNNKGGGNLVRACLAF